MKKQFIEFLKSKRILTKFNREYAIHTESGDFVFDGSRPKAVEQYFADMDSDCQEHAHDAICGAFEWRHTKDGHLFWDDIDDQWVIWYEKFKNH